MEADVWFGYGTVIDLFQERRPQLSYRISKQFLDDNLADQTDSFDMVENDEGAFYVRKISEDGLETAFDPTTDGKTIGIFILSQIDHFLFLVQIS